MVVGNHSVRNNGSITICFHEINDYDNFLGYNYANCIAIMVQV